MGKKKSRTILDRIPENQILKNENTDKEQIKQTYLWYSTVAKYPSQDRQTSTYDDIITNILHDLSRLTSHQCQEYRGTV